MSDKPKLDADRRVLLDFYRTQINTQIQTVVSIFVALFFEGVGLSFIANSQWKLPIFLLSSGFAAGLAFLQWWKMFWYARLWNVTLVAEAREFGEVSNGRLQHVEQTGIGKLYIGVNELYAEHCSRWHAPFILLSLQMKHQLLFCVLSSSIPVSLYAGIVNQGIFALFPFLVSLAVIGLLFWARFWKCCSPDQIKTWMSFKDLKHLLS